MDVSIKTISKNKLWNGDTFNKAGTTNMLLILLY